MLAKSLKTIQAMTPEQRTAYFENYAGFFPNAPKLRRYRIGIGSKTLISDDTMDLKQQFDKYLRYKRSADT